MQEEVAQNHRLLKAIVIILGVLIIGMVILMIGTGIYRMRHGAPAASVPAPLESDLAVPPGSTLRGMTPTDSEVYLQVRDGAGADHVYVLDRRTGALLWHRRLTPAQ